MSTKNPTPLFKPFSWVSEQNQAGRYDMLSNIRDLASGVAVALELVERSELLEIAGHARIIDGATARRFYRMSIAAMGVIEGYIDEHFNDMDDLGAQPNSQKGGA